MLNFKCDVIGISETKILKNYAPIYVSLKGYNFYSTPTESKRGVSLFIANNHKCKPRKNLDSLTYKSNEVEFVFIEIVTPKKNNIIIGCI